MINLIRVVRARRGGSGTPRRRAQVMIAASLVMVFGLAGCAEEGSSPIPLPGGAPRGDFYTIQVDFDNVLDLVPEASVKVNDVSVGSVERIRLHGWDARVTLRLEKKVKLPDNAVAALRQTSLLGEKFVALEPPPGEKAKDLLGEGDLIPLSRTRRSVEIEEVLASMSLILNGGGLENLKTISKEVGNALEGREDELKGTLHELNDFVGGLDDQKEDIVKAINALDRLSARLAKERGTVAKALDAMGPGLKVLSEQRKELVAMLQSLQQLGKVGTRVIKASRDDTIAVLRDLQPILTQLVNSGDNLPKSLDYLATFPLPPNVVNAIHGDYVNLHATLDLNVTEILKNLTSDPEPAPPRGIEGSNGTVADGLPRLPTDDLPPGASASRQGGLAELLLGGLTA
ncbi:MAG: MCE family protein [Micromonosporaceae bacterium]